MTKNNNLMLTHLLKYESEYKIFTYPKNLLYKKKIYYLYFFIFY